MVYSEFYLAVTAKIKELIGEEYAFKVTHVFMEMQKQSKTVTHGVLLQELMWLEQDTRWDFAAHDAVESYQIMMLARE